MWLDSATADLPQTRGYNGGMTDNSWFRTRDALYLAVLAIVLALWGADRGGLARRIEILTSPPPPAGGLPGMSYSATTGLGLRLDVIVDEVEPALQSQP